LAEAEFWGGKPSKKEGLLCDFPYDVMDLL